MRVQRRSGWSARSPELGQHNLRSHWPGNISNCYDRSSHTLKSLGDFDVLQSRVMKHLLTMGGAMTAAGAASGLSYVVVPEALFQ